MAHTPKQNAYLTALLSPLGRGPAIKHVESIVGYRLGNASNAKDYARAIASLDRDEASAVIASLAPAKVETIVTVDRRPSEGSGIQYECDEEQRLS